MTAFTAFLRETLIPAISAYGKPGKSATLTSLADKVIAGNISVAPIREWLGELQTYGKSEAFNTEQLRFAHSFYLMVEFGYTDADKAQSDVAKLVSGKADELLPLLDASNVYGTKKAIENAIAAKRSKTKNEALTRRLDSLVKNITAISELRDDGFEVDDFDAQVQSAIEELRSLITAQEPALV